MSSVDLPFAQEGYDLMGAAFEVHNVLGGGLSEEIYQQSLEIELELRSIPFQSKQKLTVYYKQKKLQTKFIPDLLVFENIVVELKVTSDLIAKHEAQLINYMRITRQSVGYLINFCPLDKLKYKRFVISDYFSH